MKIISFNINNDYRNIDKNAQIIYEMIKKHDPDIVGLQEVIPLMYDALQILIKSKYHMSTKKQGSYFNVMISKFLDPINDVPFKITSMNRSYLYQNVSSCQTLFITTHLESLPIKCNIRMEQCKQIIDECSYNKQIIIFGDTNFSIDDECISNMIYLSSTCNKYFTYDSLINSNAMTPFRSNLDRFYSSKHINNYDIKILTDIYFSDHFPILLIYKNIDL